MKAFLLLSLLLCFVLGCGGPTPDQPQQSDVVQRSNYLQFVEKVNQAESLLNEVGIFFDVDGGRYRVEEPIADDPFASISPYASISEDELRVFRKDRLSDFIKKSKTLLDQYSYQIDTSENGGAPYPSEDPAVVKLRLAEDLSQTHF